MLAVSSNVWVHAHEEMVLCISLFYKYWPFVLAKNLSKGEIVGYLCWLHYY